MSCTLLPSCLLARARNTGTGRRAQALREQTVAYILPEVRRRRAELEAGEAPSSEPDYMQLLLTYEDQDGKLSDDLVANKLLSAGLGALAPSLAFSRCSCPFGLFRQRHGICHGYQHPWGRTDDLDDAAAAAQALSASHGGGGCGLERGVSLSALAARRDGLPCRYTAETM